MRLRRQNDSRIPRVDGRRRVLILSANVGEGHAAAARALCEQLENGPDDVEVTVLDGLRGMGPVLRYVVEDGYRTQLRFMPWSYSLYYALLEHVAAVRFVTRTLLCRLGGRRLRRVIDEHRPDVIVSTYPAVTVVLGRLRRRGLVTCPTVATITDMTGLFFWAQRGIDMHLVMYDASLGPVERIAGSGSVKLVKPLIAAEFLEPRGQDVSRRELGLPVDGKVIVVSGGGWGVGDIAGAVEELSQIPDATLICLAGKNELIEEKLGSRFAGNPDVRVLGFTDKMPAILAAADVLVHSTGGVTCLEAMARGCPVVSYGLPVGHAKINTQAMANLDLVRLANSTTELRELVEQTCTARGSAGPAAIDHAPAACDVVLRAPHRVRSIPAWRPRLANTTSAVIAAMGVATWMLSTDELAAVAQRIVPSVRTLPTKKPDVAVIVRTTPGATDAVARRLHGDGVEASFAMPGVPTSPAISQLRSLGDAPMCEVTPARALRWVETRSKLRKEASVLRLHHRFYYLAPQGSLTVGQILSARTTGAREVVGSVALNSTSPVPSRPLRRGDIVVITLDGSATSMASIDRFAAELGSEHLHGVPLSTLTG
ncbi:MAG TPA: glycosyltransferase [Solirubrobacteraceae bacterium]|nr:glycosyltransferase [Solirubrobacteraceae bacterium]